MKYHKEIKATVYKTDGIKEFISFSEDESLSSLQKLVGGYIEIIHIVTEANRELGNDLVINEEGILFDLPVNPWSQYITRGTIWATQILRGDIIMIEGCLP